MSFNLRSLLSCPIVRATTISDPIYDGVLIVSNCVNTASQYQPLKTIGQTLIDYASLNKSVHSTASLIPVSKSEVPSGRLIFSGTGPLERDYDDVRRFSQAATRAMKLALSAGLRSPLLVTVPNAAHPHAEFVSALGALMPSYTPLNVRLEENKQKLERIGLLSECTSIDKLLLAMEEAFTVSRDVGETDPQRMAPPRVADYIEEAFSGSSIKVEVTSDQDEIAKEYPLMAAVNRAASGIKEHHARLIRLEYNPEGKIDETYFFVGKGVTIDTGGCDLKVNGVMHGMCRDKFGAAVVAGIFKILDLLKPKGIKAIGYMCMVRNSIGSKAYTCDEVITARSGRRIHIYNTDAEGRITMLDPLTRAKDEALHEANPHLYTLATLTGHAALTYGYYAAFMDNGPARHARTTHKIQSAGDAYGQPVEISRLHFEDYDFHNAEGEQADVRQGNTRPSVQTLRGHMTPAAFLIKASRLDEHDQSSANPLKFTHIDMGSCCGEHPTTSTPNPLVALTAGLILPRL
ncbi:unnamed protein product, partial [Mesorhabditis belari]|uniref:Cytosol aminopeptidase domain-containing protein n=1 Tax=Mesorhabditis belari TaxID=2138241 RepID=A0AAF3E815_9BILA